MFPAIFNWEKQRIFPATYTATAMLIGNLIKVGVKPEDKIIIALDSPKGTWRRDILPEYKANRKEMREKHDINWVEIFNNFNHLLEDLEHYTPFHTIKIDYLEADDIIAYGCKKFKDNECIIVSSDSDYEQLCAYPNVKIFSPKSKKYKKIKNPYKVIADKIKKETSDNLTTPVLSEVEYQKRYKVVNLLTLPFEVEEKVEANLSILPEKEWDYGNLPFKSLRERFKNIYRQDKIVSFEKKKRKKKGE